MSRVATSTRDSAEMSLAAFFAHPTGMVSDRTEMFEVVAPIDDMIDMAMSKAGKPRNSQEPDVIGCNSIHAHLGESFVARHGTWKHKERMLLPKTVPKSPGNASMCRRYGMCVSGLLELQAFLPNFIVLLKALFAKDSKWSDCAEAGGVVLEFRTLSPDLAVLSRDWANIAWVNHASWASGLPRLVDSSDQVCRRAAASFHDCALRFAPPAALVAADLFVAAGVGGAAILEALCSDTPQA